MYLRLLRPGIITEADAEGRTGQFDTGLTLLLCKWFHRVTLFWLITRDAASSNSSFTSFSSDRRHCWTNKNYIITALHISFYIIMRPSRVHLHIASDLIASTLMRFSFATFCLQCAEIFFYVFYLPSGTTHPRFYSLPKEDFSIRIPALSRRMLIKR